MWKEQFDKELAKFKKGDNAVAFTKDFISTEIIEKLIDDIPSTTDEHILEGNHLMGGKSFANLYPLKQQLRDKWL